MTLNAIIKERLGAQLFKLLSETEGAWESGLLITAPMLGKLLNDRPQLEEGAVLDPLLVLQAAVANLKDLESPILAAAVGNDGGLIVWGDKIGCLLMADDSTRFGFLGETLPKGIELAVELEDAGPMGAKYKRPKAVLSMAGKNAKGGKITIKLEVAFAADCGREEGAYASWAVGAAGAYSQDADPECLLSEGLLKLWAPPKLGSGGDRVSLYRLAEGIDVAQTPKLFRVVEASLGAKIDSKTGEPRRDRNGNIVPATELTLEDEDGVRFSLWPEVNYGWSKAAAPKDPSKGGYGWNDAMIQHIAIGRPIYLLIRGLKYQFRWNSEKKEEVPVFDDEGQQRLMPDMVFTGKLPGQGWQLAPAPTRSALSAEPIDERPATELLDAAGLPF